MTPNAGDFAGLVLSQVPAGREFEPEAHYDKDGDCIEFVAAADSYYAERIDQLVTVFYSRETGEIIGSLIKNVSKLIRDIVSKNPGFCLEIHDGRVRLQHLFRARLWAADPKETPKERVLVYKKLARVAEQAGAEVADLNLAPSC